MTIDSQATEDTRETNTQADAIQLDERDNVATLLHAVEAGRTCAVAVPGGSLRLSAIDSIPMHHKIALQAVAKGAPLLKYGEVIGEARSDIAVGAHVHIHNLISLRAR